MPPRHQLVRGLDAEPLGEHGAQRLDLHLAEPGQRSQVVAQGLARRLGPDTLGIAARSHT